MSWFDRFTSKKGKEQAATPKKGVVKVDAAKAAEQKAFANVPSGKEALASKPAAAAPSATPSAPSRDVRYRAHRVLLRPVVTEKSTRLGSQSQYVFEVATRASKADVRQAVFHVYGVKPISVNVMVNQGKSVRFGRTYGQTIARKKAVVTLPAGKTIDVFST